MPRGVPKTREGDDSAKSNSNKSAPRKRSNQQPKPPPLIEPPIRVLPPAFAAFEEDELQYSEIEFGSRVAEGEYGEIYKGKLWGQDVALKLVKLKTKEGRDINVLKEFEDEVRVMKRLRHPNIVEYLGACLQPPNLCIACEYCALGNVETWILDNYVNKKKKVPMRLVLDLCIDAAAGLNWMHHKGYVHRDVKPSNLLLDEHRRVKVADFGMTYLLGKTEAMNLGAAGTQWYMAPEVLQDEKYGIKCDVYSFAIVLCELLHGEHPFFYSDIPSATPEFTKVIVAGLRPKIPRSCPQVLVDLMEQCWVETPSDRPTLDHCLEVLRTFRGHLNGEGRITRLRSRSHTRDDNEPSKKAKDEEEEDEGEEEDESASSCQSASESEEDNKDTKGVLMQVQKELSESRKEMAALAKSSAAIQKKSDSLIKRQALQIQKLQKALEEAEGSRANGSNKSRSSKRKKLLESETENDGEEETEEKTSTAPKSDRILRQAKKPVKKLKKEEESDWEEEELKKKKRPAARRRS